TAAGSALQTGVVREIKTTDAVPLFVHDGWRQRFPWLLQGTTGRGSADDEFDLSFFGRTPTGLIQARWQTVLAGTAFPAVVHARQVHHSQVLLHRNQQPGVSILPDADGHLTGTSGIVLAVSVADCVPVFLVDEVTRTIALLHAGWRGIAAQILPRGVDFLLEHNGGSAADVHCHLGPAICGNCYEVGPEVHEALGQARPRHSLPIDLREVLKQQAFALGLRQQHITQSEFCTRCDNGLFFSHRAGDRGRQMGLLGLRTP
ncbi:MAG: polyphenol oxidase family protein, partial [Longimicrobiales bacterium]